MESCCSLAAAYMSSRQGKAQIRILDSEYPHVQTPILPAEIWSSQRSCGLSWERLGHSMLTKTPFHICSVVWMWLLCIKGCASHGPSSLAQGVLFCFNKRSIFSWSVCASLLKMEKEGRRERQPDRLAYVQRALKSRSPEKWDGRGEVVRELAVCQGRTPALCVAELTHWSSERGGVRVHSSGQMELCFEAAESCTQFIRLGQGNNGSTTLCVLPVRAGPRSKGSLCR